MSYIKQIFYSTRNLGYFDIFHSYINYGNIPCTSITKLKKIFTYQEKAAKVIFFADRLTHAKPLMLARNALIVYQGNIYQNLILLYKAHAGTAPSIFFKKFLKINHNYPTIIIIIIIVVSILACLLSL